MSKKIGINSTFSFGKYKGKKAYDIAVKYPRYILWLNGKGGPKYVRVNDGLIIIARLYLKDIVAQESNDRYVRNADIIDYRNRINKDNDK